MKNTFCQIATMATPHRAVAAVRSFSKQWFKQSLCVVLLAVQGLVSVAFAEETNTLKDISFVSLPGDRVQLTLTLEKAAKNPVSFTIDNPARIALDLKDTALAMDKKNKPIGIGKAKSVNVVESAGRTRLIINMAEVVPYETRVSGNNIYVTLDSGSAVETARSQSANTAKTKMVTHSAASNVDKVDFRRGDKGEGRIVITLSDASSSVDMREEGGKIVVDFLNTNIPKRLERRLDVTDFATPVKTIDTSKRGGDVRMVVTPIGEYDHLAYQSNNVYTIELKPFTKEEKEAENKKKFGYTGERLSLNFQNIEVRAVLQLLADFTGLNMVVSDSVNGSLTLRLKNVPWDQAMDIILKTKGLAYRKTGNVLLVAPSEEIAAREKLELEAKKQIEELAPLHTEWFQINYANAEDLDRLFKEKQTLLSPRGSTMVDPRTNTLLIQDTAAKLDEVRKLVARLDIPVRQVLIESRIVIANNDFSKDLGVRFGATAVSDNSGDGVISTTGTAAGNDTVVSDALGNLQGTGQPFPVGVPSLDDRLIVDLPAAANAGSLALAVLGSDYLLDMELSAMQSEGRGEIVSSPRVITANQKEALIKQGVEIPYQQGTSSGATEVQFKTAALSLQVTPQITPDDRIIMDLTVNKDSVGAVFAGVPSIDTRAVSTQVLVSNGDTVVLGGVYEQTKVQQSSRIPFFGDLPILGHLFRDNHNIDDKSELLIFVTPKIMKESLVLQN